MDKRRKARWFSLILTGAGQFYMGEKKKGFLFLLAALSGVLTSCIGAALVYGTFLKMAPLMVSYNKLFLGIGFIFFLAGILLIIISGLKSIKDITLDNGEQEKKNK